ncbi:FkbM family methyltransferase [Pectobacterium aroidearum]|uniref:FkbM family methyltransferase n=2 Tax=Pectobacterium aroidearum TaxID=1201031 RepID=UPI0032EB5813
MKPFRKTHKIVALMSAIKQLSFRTAYQIIIRATDDKPKVTVKESNHGTFCGFENDYLFQMALTNGSNESHFEEIVNIILNETSNVLDVGANIGTHAILLSKVAHKGKVFSFEPQSLVFSVLQNNIIMNHCSNVTAYRFAISNIDNETISMEPFSFKGDKINNGALRIDNSGNFLGDLVLSKKLDSFNLPKIDFIKLDIQGSEIKALSGANDLISRDRPIIFVEIEEQHLKSLGGSSKDLIEKILGLDYVLFRIETDYPCDHLCIPKEKINYFDSEIRPKLSLELSIIEGKRVALTFESEFSQNYKNITILE